MENTMKEMIIAPYKQEETKETDVDEKKEEDVNE